MKFEEVHGNIAVIFVLLVVLYLYGGLQSFWMQVTDTMRVSFAVAFLAAVIALGCQLQRPLFYRVGVAFSIVGFASVILTFLIVSLETGLSPYIPFVLIAAIAHIALFAYLLPLTNDSVPVSAPVKKRRKK